MGDAPQSRSEELADRNTALAVARTVLAAERTLMAWIRTALAMIGGGFGIYKALRELSELRPDHPLRPGAARNLGLFLSSLGAASLLAGIAEYVHVTRTLGATRAWLRPGFFVACAMLVLGVAVLAGMLAGVGPLR
jgi:putative membrane protein